MMNATGAGRMRSVELPRQPGSYLLMLKLAAAREIQVGRLAVIGFRRGWYAYAGSAFGSGGLAGRLRHHLRPVQKRHWHIDYLRDYINPVEVWVSYAAEHLEHKWAGVLIEMPEIIPIQGFGCSDCKCNTHLFLALE